MARRRKQELRIVFEAVEASAEEIQRRTDAMFDILFDEVARRIELEKSARCTYEEAIT